MKPTQSRIIGYEKEFKTTLKKIRTKFKKYKKINQIFLIM